MNPIVLSAADLAIAAALVVASAGLSFALSLGVHARMLVAASRMVVQLLLVGLFLRTVFLSQAPAITVLVVVLMLMAASREVGARGSRRFRGRWQFAIGTMSVVSATVPVVIVVLATALRPTPWFDARHAIPLVGIVLGTVMNAGSLTLNSILTDVTRERAAIEARLALGHTRREALAAPVRRGVLTGVLPTLNQMAAAGIITLPGIMTGQVLAGMDPLEAGKYQILLMFVLAAAGFLGSVVTAFAATGHLTDGRHRLRLDRLRPD